MHEETAVSPDTTPHVKPGRLPPLPCPHCGTVDVPRLGPGTSVHAARLLCAGCARFLKWAPRVLVERLRGKELPGMGSVNRVILVGTISKYGVTVKYATSGAPCASFTLVLSEQGQDGKVHSLFVECEIWGKKAEGVSELEPGQLALFEGKLARRKRGEQWETVVSGFDVTPVLAPVASLTGSTN
jgi:primosomal replication protein N